MPGKMAGSDPRPSARVTRVLVAVGTSRLSCKRAGKTRTLMPVWDSSGESRSLRHPRLFLSFYDFEELLWCCVATFCRHHEARYARMPTS
jgi:hypothetical protein